LTQLQKLLAGQIDLLGELRRRIAEFKPVVDQEKKLTEMLLKRAEEWKPDQTGEDQGALYIMRTGPRSEKQVVKSYQKISRWLKQKKFLELSSITFEALKANLTAEQYAAVIEKQRTGMI
jgi:hypothetical protein